MQSLLSFNGLPTKVVLLFVIKVALLSTTPPAGLLTLFTIPLFQLYQTYSLTLKSKLLSEILHINIQLTYF